MNNKEDDNDILLVAKKKKKFCKYVGKNIIWAEDVPDYLEN